jgi:DNA modification methylase
VKDLFCKQTIIQGDCLEKMREMQENSIDCILTDPPYGLSFMGKKWDKGIPNYEYWEQAYRVCKPGAIMLAFGGTRTYHHLACFIEGVGWQIRDSLMWLYGSGFPKSMDLSKGIDKSKGLEREIIGIKPGHEGFEDNKSHSLNDGWNRPWANDPDKVKLYHSQTAPSSDLAKTFSGYGTALKPAYEPILLCMKPLDGTFAQNAEKWGVAGLNIDASRIGTDEILGRLNHCTSTFNYKNTTPFVDNSNGKGRWPSNLLLDEEAAAMLDAQSGNLGKSRGTQTGKNGSIFNYPQREYKEIGHNDSGGASRFFYCAKASSSERNKGCEGMPIIESKRTQDGGDDTRGRPIPRNQNHHPTVKPTKLLEYLLMLIMPPSQDAVVLDPFMGSGSTLVAAKNLGFNALGIEIEEEYCEIARNRLK